MGFATRCLAVFLLGTVLLRVYPHPAGNGKLTLIPVGDVLTADWLVQEGSWDEGLFGITARMTVKNISNSTLDGAFWYGELLDGQGRVCFSTVFSQDDKTATSGPIRPAESRAIDSHSGALFPASEPVAVRLYLIQQGTPGEPGFFSNPNVLVKAPATSNGSLAVGEDLVHLPTATQSDDRSFQDLALLKIHTNEDGKIDSLQPLDVTGEDVRSWIMDLVQHKMIFYPATIGGRFVSADSLLMVRKMPSQGDPRALFVPPDRSPWLKNLMASEPPTNPEVPAVTLIMLTRPATTVKTLAGEIIQRGPFPEDLFELKYWNSEWSLSAYRFVPDPSLPHRLKRVLGSPMDK